MSRVDDLADLVKTTNDILFANEAQNIRTVYIQVDDLCELALKSYLQANVQNWKPADGQFPNGRPRFKGFWTVVNEARSLLTGNHRLQELLDQFCDRREERNHFFHDHTLSGLTVAPEKCLQALCELYELLGILFSDFWDRVEASSILKTQIAVIRLKRRTYEDGSLNVRYQRILQQWTHGEDSKYLPRRSAVLLRYPCLGYEFSVIYMDAQGLYDELDSAGLI
jgi:hypothetical protein